jgi:hypothetical protein
MIERSEIIEISNKLLWEIAKLDNKVKLENIEVRIEAMGNGMAFLNRTLLRLERAAWGILVLLSLILWKLW